MSSSASVSTAQSAVKAAAQTVANGIANGAEEGVKRPAFTMGLKRLYLPKHVLTFIRPREGQPPNLATFKVPLTFNKFDFRDYLWNVYNVEVTGVRSFINQQRLKQRSSGPSPGGKWYRPKSVKMMIADLKQPFVWPEPPENKDAWDNKLFLSVQESHKKAAEERQERQHGRPKIRTRGQAEPSRAQLAKAAKLLAFGLRKWRPQAETAKMIQAAQTYEAERNRLQKLEAEQKARKEAEKARAIEETDGVRIERAEPNKL